MLDPTLSLIFNQIADIAALTVFAGMVSFTILYSTFYQWNKRKAGKSVLMLAVAFVTVALISSLALWIGPDYWLRPLWRMIGWLLCAYAVGYLIYALIYNWRDRHPIKIDARTSPTDVVE